MSKDPKSKVKNEQYIHISGWMVNELELKGNELLVYAIIYGFSQAENQVFNGSLKYLADWTNSTKQGVIRCLKSLTEKGFIKKEDEYINGVKFCKYYATELNTLLNKVAQGMQQSLIGGGKQSLPNIIDKDNANDNSIINYRGAASRFQPPTVEEVRAYCIERKNSVDANRFVDFYTANGWMVGKNKMKDWKAAVRTWERNSFSNSRNNNVQSNSVPDEPNILDAIF